MIGKARGRQEIETAGATHPECLREHPNGAHFDENRRWIQSSVGRCVGVTSTGGLTSALGEIINIF
jgi:hypothetical protein